MLQITGDKTSLYCMGGVVPLSDIVTSGTVGPAGPTGPAGPNISSFNDFYISTLTVSTINGFQFPQSPPPPLTSTFTDITVQNVGTISSIVADIFDGKFVFGVDVNASQSLNAPVSYISSINYFDGVHTPANLTIGDTTTLYDLQVSSINNNLFITNPVSDYIELGPYRIQDSSNHYISLQGGAMIYSQSAVVLDTRDTAGGYISLLSGGDINLNIATLGYGIRANGDLFLQNALYDASSSAGTAGQVLTTTGTATSWENLPTGPTGPPGYSSSYFPYQADTGATSGNPGNGHIIWNTASQLLASVINVSHLTQDNVDIDVFLAQITVNSQYILQDANNSANYQTWKVSATPTIIPNSYVSIPVVLVASGGSTFANNHQIVFIISQAVGATGPTGPTGAPGPFSIALANKLGIVSATDFSLISTLSSSAVGTLYIPDGSPPVSGGVNSAWRFTKAINSGTAKINWYSLNRTFGLTPPYSNLDPSRTILKRDLTSVWALITSTSPILTQGYLSFELLTYAYQSPPLNLSTFNSSWAYSFPSNALPTSVLAYAGGAETTVNPRLNRGYTYLIYAQDLTPKALPNVAITSPNFVNSGGMYPSQSEIAYTLRDPYDIYPQYAHYGMGGVQYKEGASTPTVSYTDSSFGELSQIRITTSSTAPATGTVAFDFTVQSMGFRGKNALGNIVNEEYNLTF